MHSTARRSFALALLLGLQPAQAAEVLGVAFVHGTGVHTNATRDYWQPGIIDSVRQGLPDRRNHVVISCDFDQYMWKPNAAGCLADQLTGFIDRRGISQLVVITHSNGGNVMRWILSNPTYDRRYPKIIRTVRKVTALAPSSAGTPLADAVINGSTFETLLGWLLGKRSDAVRQQQVAHMATYNAQNLYGSAGRPALPTPFRAVVGSDVDSSPTDTDSYCGGYAANLGLEFTQNWLSSCSDGFLDCSSQQAAGSVWFIDTARTQGAEPLSHNQSRRACFGLGTLLRNDLTQ
ncbi:hypothetical protein [Stenotrophomonas sp. SORGH_AS_0321]|uniref:hypothetical protein n=1 Tax=Stenotrophomonas sp. SORGH_AS_0321 TaxID=3041787 RepID=UPI00285D6DC8|nr:hypothetical protein [Stenotrophomonas sp. SORGH_AS_0321]MDR6096301.1 pimeloyl-ACP methyl ester carboxylesterase [Stenotrophomonas sp. SORGH_AS_0321]